MNEKPIVFESNNKYLTGIVLHALGPNEGSNKGGIRKILLSCTSHPYFHVIIRFSS